VVDHNKSWVIVRTYQADEEVGQAAQLQVSSVSRLNVPYDGVFEEPAVDKWPETGTVMPRCQPT
jgi:hypothetical protein